MAVAVSRKEMIARMAARMKTNDCKDDSNSGNAWQNTLAPNATQKRDPRCPTQNPMWRRAKRADFLVPGDVKGVIIEAI